MSRKNDTPKELHPLRGLLSEETAGGGQALGNFRRLPCLQSIVSPSRRHHDEEANDDEGVIPALIAEDVSLFPRPIEGRRSVMHSSHNNPESNLSFIRHGDSSWGSSGRQQRQVQLIIDTIDEVIVILNEAEEDGDFDIIIPRNRRNSSTVHVGGISCDEDNVSSKFKQQ